MNSQPGQSECTLGMAIDATERLRGALQRIVDRGVEDTLSALHASDTKLESIGRSGGASSYVISRDLLNTNFRRHVCDPAAELLIEREGDAAGQYADLLEELLTDAQNKIQERFDQKGSGARAFGEKEFEGQPQALRADLAKTRAGTINDLHIGIVGGKGMKSKAGIHVDMRGASDTQFALGKNIQQTRVEEGRVSAIDYHSEMIGRILSHLVNHGLERVDLEPTNALEIMTPRSGNEDQVTKEFSDVLHWMEDEGLIRVSSIQGVSDTAEAFNGVQLTSKGIAIIRLKPDDPELGESIEKKVIEAKPAGLDATIYTKIGAFVGGVLGSTIKTAAG